MSENIYNPNHDNQQSQSAGQVRKLTDFQAFIQNLSEKFNPDAEFKAIGIFAKKSWAESFKKYLPIELPLTQVVGEAATDKALLQFLERTPKNPEVLIFMPDLLCDNSEDLFDRLAGLIEYLNATYEDMKIIYVSGVDNERVETGLRQVFREADSFISTRDSYQYLLDEIKRLS